MLTRCWAELATAELEVLLSCLLLQLSCLLLLLSCLLLLLLLSWPRCFCSRASCLLFGAVLLDAAPRLAAGS